MTNDKGTIKIPREDFERHNANRKDLGLSWGDYIDGQAPEIVDALMDKLDRIEQGVTTAEERTNAIAKKLEEVNGDE